MAILGYSKSSLSSMGSFSTIASNKSPVPKPFLAEIGKIVSTPN